jgi:DNA topoisomerase-1
LDETNTTPSTPESPEDAAASAGLRYVNDCELGIRRVRLGGGSDEPFGYVDANGMPVTSPRILERIARLRIPPAWKDVWICARANGHLQATGRDARGRKQYRYHPDWSAARSLTKYDRMVSFGEALPALRERVDADLSRRGLPREKVLATVIRLMELTLIRIGNREYARANRSYGLTTLRDKHVQIDGAAVGLEFVGKSGQVHTLTVRDRRLARIVKQCRDIPGYHLFQYYDEDGARQEVNSGEVNEYLREVTGQEFSAKDFRTWGGSVLAAAALCETGPAETETAAAKNIVEVVKEVAAALGNRPATCRKYYVHPAVLEAYTAGRLVDEWRAALAEAQAEPVAGLSAEEAALLAVVRRAA